MLPSFERSMPSVERSRIDLMGEVLARFGEARVRVTGSSMLPCIRPGDVLTIRRRAIDEVRVGDVALFVHGERLFAHRVIAHHRDHLITRGQSVPCPDAPVKCSDLLGTAVLLERAGTCMMVRSRVGPAARVIAAAARRSSRVNHTLQRIYAWRSRKAKAT
jgi:signal peptidase I